jgi:hypothetical protein
MRDYVGVGDEAMIARNTIETKHLNVDHVITRAAYPLTGCQGCRHIERFRSKGCGILREYQSPCFVRNLGEKRAKEGEELEEWEW